MNEKIEVPTMQVPALKRICMTIGQLPTSYLETMSYYEMLVWFVNYLRDDIIPVVNANGEATKELQQLYLDLQNYVNNYFDNLDVQEEIDNKLDEMYEDGTLTEIIGDYIEVAKKSYIIQEIETESIYVENNKGNVFITKIPHLDSKGELIKAKHGFANNEFDSSPLETATSFSSRNNATFVSNASIYAVESQVSANVRLNELVGLYIHDGEVIKDNRQYFSTSFLENRWILGMTSDNTLKAYIGTTDSTTILNDDVVETYQAFIPLMVNGVYYKPTLDSLGVTYWETTTFNATSDVTPNYNKIYYTTDGTNYEGHFHLESFAAGVTYYEEVTTGTQRYQRQIIAQDSNKNLYFITNNGKGDMNNVGLSLNDFYTLAKYYQCTFAFVLDGGGSTESVYRNILLNNPSDNPTNYSVKVNGKGYTIRAIPDYIYFSKEMTTEYDEDINDIYTNLENQNHLQNSQQLNEDLKFMTTTHFYENAGEQHIFDFNKWNATTKTFDKSMEIYFDNPTSFKGGLSIKDVTNNRNVLRVHNNITDGIQFFGAKLGLMFDQVRQLSNNTDLNSLPSTFAFSRANQDQGISNKPFTSTECYNFVIWQFGWDTLKVQIGIGIAQTTPLKIRVYTTSWGAWRTITTTA